MKIFGNLKSFAFIMLLVAGLSAQAQIVLPPTTITYNGIYNGSVDPAYQLTITYEVTGTPGDYTYTYVLAGPVDAPLTEFAIGGSVDPINTVGATILPEGDIILPPGSAVTSDSIVFEWAVGNDITNSTVAFTSPYAPTLSTFNVDDDDIGWTSPNAIPAPVPETSTIVAGLMMVVPLAFSAVRVLRRERKALVPVRKN